MPWWVEHEPANVVSVVESEEGINGCYKPSFTQALIGPTVCRMNTSCEHRVLTNNSNISCDKTPHVHQGGLTIRHKWIT